MSQKQRPVTPRWSLTDARLAAKLHEQGCSYKAIRERLSCCDSITWCQVRALLRLATVDKWRQYLWKEECDIIAHRSEGITQCCENIAQWRRTHQLPPRSPSSIKALWRQYHTNGRNFAGSLPRMPQEEERAFLEQAVNAPSFAMVCREYNELAARKGYRAAPENVIKLRMERLGLSPNDRPPYPAIPVSWVSRMGGIPYSRIRTWIHSDRLATQQWRRVYITSPSAFRRFLDEHYYLFEESYLTPELLRWLELDLQQIDRLKAVVGTGRRKRVQVGVMVYANADEAAKALGLTKGQLKHRIYRGEAKSLPPLPMHPITGPAAAAHRHLKTSFSRRVASYRAPKAQ